MEGENIYIVPDYYPDFRCKCGDCRRSCCDGWGVSVSMREYFRLIGMECSPELRRRLDAAFQMVSDPSPERYARITPNWHGNCPMHDESGLCALQMECGEEVLPAVCRCYPRSPRRAEGYECACSNACEAVLEMLLGREEPLRLISVPLAFPWPVQEEEISGVAGARAEALRILQDRSLPVRERLTRLEEALTGAVSGGDRFENVLRYNEARGLESFSVYDYAVRAREIVASGGFEACEREFEAEFPGRERFFEHVIVNHALFTGFPRGDLVRACAGLRTAFDYAYFLCVCCARDERSLIDVCTAAFRLLGHS